MNKPKILFFDIETMSNLAYVWGKYDQNVIAYKKEWEILCFAYKWAGQKSISWVGQRDFKSKTDKEVCQKLWELFNEADLIVAHNGDKFDVKKANTRFLKHGLLPYKPPATVDTLKAAKKYFNFNSNRLDDLANYLGLGRKLPNMNFEEVWLGCEAGDKKAWVKMEKYNKIDVKLLEGVYLWFRKWMTNHPMLQTLNGLRGCSCGSYRIKKNGFLATSLGRKQVYKCNDCGATYSVGASKGLPNHGEDSGY